MQFTDLNLKAPVQQGIDEAGFDTCTEVQVQVFQHTLAGRDVCVQSQTGTGKTAAFLISIFQLFEERGAGHRALVVAPTRELAVQIEQEAKLLGSHLAYKIGSIYGGVGYGPQEKLLAEGAELIIGTPGRLLDFNQSNKLDLRQVDILVIDEADRLFDMGFYPDIRKMMKRARPREERTTMLFSATLSTRVRNLAWQFMNDPAEVEIRPENIVVEEVDQQLYHVSKDEKMRLLLGVLAAEKPETALIFCNTKRMVEVVAKRLERNGHRCEFIIGDLPQKKRLHIIDRMKEGDLSFLVATDVAARGLHINELDLVINYDLPEDPESYVHRIGRTARAGKSGRAVSFACERYVYSLESIEQLIDTKIPSAIPGPDLFVDDESAAEHITVTHAHGGTGHGGARPPRGRSRSSSGRPPGDSRPHTGSRSRTSSHSREGSQSRGGDRPPRSGERPSRGRENPPRKAPARGADGRPREQQGDRRPHAAAAAEAGPSRHDKLDDRIEYYRKKYGEEFAPSGGERNEQQKARTAKPSPERRKPEESNERGDDAGRSDKRRRGILGRLFGKK